MSGRAWVQANVGQDIRFGVGAIDQVPQLVRELGVRRALLITSAGRHDSEACQRVERGLGRTLASTFAGVVTHLPADVVRTAFDQAQADGVDGIVTFGGGSAIDCGKAVSFFVEQQAGTPGRTVLDRPATVHLAVPTTYSPGVLGGWFTMTDPHTHTKGSAGTPTIAPSGVVYDPAVVDLDPLTAAGTGMAALAAATEGIHGDDRSPETEALALAACQRIMGVLPLVVDTPDDVVVRSDLLEGAVLAARVLQHTGHGPIDALAQLLGGRTGAPHGPVVAVLLPAVLRWQATGDPVAFARLAEALGGDEAAVAAAELDERIGLPGRLRAFGIAGDDLDAVARLSQAHPGLRRAVPPLDEEHVRELLAEVA